jgi:ergothioneine biosynthesis protein EgtB
MLATVQKLPRRELFQRYRRVRQASLDMCAGLEPTEFRLQPMDDVSPPWWNLGHTSWFFARNVLAAFGGERAPEDEQYDYLLNSYYASLGERLPRQRRGMVTRPTTEEIYGYRASVDRRIAQLLETIPDDRFADMAAVLRIGIEHEQQHQELFYTEIKCILAQNPLPLRRAYRPAALSDVQATDSADAVAPYDFVPFDGGLLEFGNREEPWCWDNELPVHRHYLEPFALADRLATNGEFLSFIEDGGYGNQLLWLDNGWQQCQSQQWQAPLYWERVDGQWHEWTLAGLRPLAFAAPVCHVSFYEADAFARWQSETVAEMSGVRLPTEREWEHAARSSDSQPMQSNFLESALLHPRACEGCALLSDLHGVLWQWTSSYYEPYPGYRSFPGAMAEYNGKFMDNQRVLRGGSCVTPREHYRLSYRNFWPAGTRFQFTGIRLARGDAGS